MYVAKLETSLSWFFYENDNLKSVQQCFSLEKHTPAFMDHAAGLGQFSTRICCFRLFERLAGPRWKDGCT